MIDQKGSRPRGTAGSGKACLQEIDDATEYGPLPAADQARNVLQFRRAPARRSSVLEVRISVRTKASPYGRSLPFALSHDALDRLLDIATRLERRA